MLAQRARHLVTIQARTTSLNAYREDVSSWTTHRQVYAGVEPVSGKEYTAAGATRAEVLVRLVCRYEDVSDVTTRMRVSFDSETYDIVDVINERTANRMVSLMCKRGVSEGGQ
jgi:SPP1 family predicted phage head-tail adaptor